MIEATERPDGAGRPPEADAPPGRRVTFGGALIALAVVVFVVFWVWALFFASKESINRVDDRGWADRAQAICASATAEREGLADYRRIDFADAEMLRERGDLIDRSTDVVEQMLDDVVAVSPTDAKGAEIVPAWDAEYRIYLGNRRDYADLMRAGVNEPFRQAEREGVPITERLTRFAVDNHMGDCAPPRDL